MFYGAELSFNYITRPTLINRSFSIAATHHHSRGLRKPGVPGNRFICTGINNEQLANEEAVLKQLFTAHYEKLCRHAYAYLQDEQLAEDVVQNTFIRIWESKRDLLNNPSIAFYLITAVRNNSISALRQVKASRTRYAEELPEPDPEPFFSRSEHHETSSAQQQRAAEALDRLPPKCREVFLLAKLHQMSYKDVARHLDISVKTVENQMGKALRVLREVLAIVVYCLLTYLLILEIQSRVGFLAPECVSQ